MKKVTFKTEEWEEREEIFCPRCAAKGMWKLVDRDYYICAHCNRTYSGRLITTGENEKKVIELIIAELQKDPIG